MACITEGATGFPVYNDNVPFENGFLSELLLAHGYDTHVVGKWHLIPSAYETAAGPYDRWPLGRGLERFYPSLGGDISQRSGPTTTWASSTTVGTLTGRNLGPAKENRHRGTRGRAAERDQRRDPVEDAGLPADVKPPPVLAA